MPATVTYPSVCIEEMPSGVHTITGAVTSITAFFGRTPKGALNSPVSRIHSAGRNRLEFFSGNQRVESAFALLRASQKQRFAPRYHPAFAKGHETGRTSAGRLRVPQQSAAHVGDAK